VPAGKVSEQTITEMDILPTIQTFLKVKGPTFNIDGKNISDLWFGKEGATSPHEALVFYAGSELQAIRRGNWKLHFPHPFITPDAELGRDGKPANWGNMKPAEITQSGIEGIATRHGYKVAQQKLALYDLKADPAESNDLSADHPEVVAELQKLAETYRRDLGDSLTQTVGEGVRPLGMAP
jgi:arylsulfatase A-like enzyme